MQSSESYKDFRDIFLQPSQVYPELTNGIVLTDSGNPWTFGNYAQIIAANTITRNFYIVGAYPSAWSNPVEGQIQLAYGANDIELANLRILAIFGAFIRIPKNFSVGPIPANSQIRARYATIGGAGDTITILIKIKECI